MTVDQVAAYLQLNRLTVYRYVREGKIPAARIGKVYRILRADVEQFLETRKTPAASRRQTPLLRRDPTSRAAPSSARRADEIAVRPHRRARRQSWDALRLSSEPLDLLIRGLN